MSRGEGAPRETARLRSAPEHDPRGGRGERVCEGGGPGHRGGDRAGVEAKHGDAVRAGRHGHPGLSPDEDFVTAGDAMHCAVDDDSIFSV